MSMKTSKNAGKTKKKCKAFPPLGSQLALILQGDLYLDNLGYIDCYGAGCPAYNMIEECQM